MTGRAMRLWPRASQPEPSMYAIRVGDRALARFGRDWDEAVRSAKAAADATSEPVTITSIHEPEKVLWTSEGRPAWLSSHPTSK